MAHDPKLTGVGGWLLFFVVIIAVIAPLYDLSEILDFTFDPRVAAFFSNDLRAILVFHWVLVAGVTITSWFLAWRLIKVRVWKSVRLAIVGIWITRPGAVTLEWIGMYVLSDRPVRDNSPLYISLVWAVGFCTIWTAYFLLSKRARNTYGARDEAMSEVFE